MLSVVARSKGWAQDYFQTQKDEYYLGQATETFYGGKACKFAGDPVLESSGQFVKLKSGKTFMDFIPDGKGERACFDMVFTVDKSLSVLIELTDDPKLREELIEIHNNAVCEAMQEFEKMAYTRLSHRVAGKKIIDPVYPGKVEWAAFTHHTSQDNDPDVHTHVVVPNRIKVFGKDYAMEPADLLKPNSSTKIALGKFYRASVVNQVRKKKEILVNISDYKNFFYEVAGVSEETAKQFSKRSNTIKAEYEIVKDDYAESEKAKVKQKIATETRGKKDKGKTIEELREIWRAESPQKNISVVKQSVNLATAEDIDNAFASAWNKLSENRSSFTELNLMVAVRQNLIYENLRFNEKDLHAALKKKPKKRS